MAKPYYDWPTLERTFVDTPDLGQRVNLKTLSRRFNIPYQSVRRHAAAHKWIVKRDDKIRRERKIQASRQ